jgi:hypothetical protein
MQPARLMVVCIRMRLKIDCGIRRRTEDLMIGHLVINASVARGSHIQINLEPLHPHQSECKRRAIRESPCDHHYDHG